MGLSEDIFGIVFLFSNKTEILFDELVIAVPVKNLVLARSDGTRFLT